MSSFVVAYEKDTNRYRVKLHNGRKTKHIAYCPTREEAQIAIEQYKQTHYTGIINYDKLAKDPSAWEKEAKSVIHRLSNLPNASKVERDPFSSVIDKEWL